MLEGTREDIEEESFTERRAMALAEADDIDEEGKFYQNHPSQRSFT